MAIYPRSEIIRPFSSPKCVNTCGRVRPTSRSGLFQRRHLAFSSPLLMRQRPSPLHPFLPRCLHIYAVLATIYTLCKLCVSVLPHQSLSRNHLYRPPRPRINFPSNMTVQQAEEFLWSNFSLANHHPLAAWDPILTRAFPRLMHPSRIIPYYYRATGVFENGDITVTTLISSDRFPVFRNLVRRYKGVLILAISPVNHPRRPFRPDICHNPRLSALSENPSRSAYYVYIFTGLLNLCRRPSRSLSIPDV